MGGSAALRGRLSPRIAVSPQVRIKRPTRFAHRISTSIQHPGYEVDDTNQDAFNAFVKLLWDERDPGKARQILESGSVNLAARANGKTALHYAALEGHASLVRELVAMGSQIDAVDEQRGTTGMTPLMWAAMNGHVEVCKV